MPTPALIGECVQRGVEAMQPPLSAVLGAVMHIELWVVVALLGAAVGIGELLARYEDQPAYPLRTRPGVFYIVLNAAAAVGAYALLTQFDIAPLQSGTADVGRNKWVTVFVAGLGAMALLRTSFTVQYGADAVTFGFSPILNSVLEAVSDAVDREQAKSRDKMVRDLLTGLTWQQARALLPTYGVALMQNITPEQRRELDILIQRWDSTTADAFGEGTDEVAVENLKLRALGLHLLNLMGIGVLSAAIATLRADLSSGRSLPMSVIDQSELPQAQGNEIRNSGIARGR
jgi:hypothetical protein